MKQKLQNFLMIATIVCILVVSVILIVIPRNYSITYDTVYDVQNDNPTQFSKSDKENIQLVPLQNTEWYAFTGWYSNPERTEKVEIIDVSNDEDVTLYAGWQPINYTATYKINGETYFTQVFNANEQSWQNPDIENTPAGYTVKWEDFDVTPCDFTVNAVFTPLSYSLNYSGIIGATHNNPISYTVEDEDIVLQDAHLEYYDFLGWFVEGRRVTVISTATAQNLDLQAKWKLTDFAINYQNVKGTIPSDFPTSYTYESEQIKLPTPFADHYTFNGWIDQNGNPIKYIPKGSSGNITLSATYTPITYNITYKNTQNANLQGFPTTYTIESETFEIPQINFAGYTYLGWRINDSGSYDSNCKIYKGSHGDIVLTLVNSLNVYSINYKNIKGTNSNPTRYTIESGDITLENLQADHFDFLGWEDENGEKITTIKQGTSKHLTLTAIWKPIEYSITYLNTLNADLSEFITYYVYTDIYQYLPTPKSQGYNFLGWFDENDKKVETAIKPRSYGNLVLSAKWELTTYTISYNVGYEIDISNFPTTYNMESPTFLIPDANKNYYEFEGWYDKEGNLVEYVEKGSTKNLVLTPKFTPINYKITYTNCKEYGVSDEDFPKTYNVNLIANLPIPAREHYFFGGWYDESGNRIQKLAFSGKDVVLEARWVAITYNIYYQFVESALVAGYPTTYTIETPTFALPVLTEDYYDFLGWEDENGNIYSSIKQGSSGNLHITPAFSPITYNVIYHNTKNISTDLLPKTYTFESDTFKIGEISSNYHEFLGWYDETDTLVEEISKGSFGEINLYAKWNPINYAINYNVKFNVDDSAFVKTYTFDSESITLPTLQIEHYNFNGWVDQNGRPYIIIESGSHGDIYLTAKFTPISYTITYLGELSESVQNPAVYTVEDEFTFNCPAKRGYTFVGWTDESGNSLSQLKKGSFGNLRLTSTWKITTYNIIYNNTHNADLSALEKTYTVESETVYIANIEQKGFVFNGWVDEYGNDITFIQSGSAGDVNIFAKWTANQYVITLNTSYGELMQNQFTVSYKENYTLPVLSCEGKTFLGWFTNTGETGERYTDQNGNSVEGYPLYVSRMLFARWETVKCTITYNTNGGSEVESIEVPYGETFNEDFIPVKDNSMFAGWYSSDFAQKYTNSTIIKANVQVYAKWITGIPVSNASEFLAIASNPSGNYYLTQDVSLDGAVLSPIAVFSGTLDGMGYSVKNFMLNAPSVSGNYGFIGHNTGTIQNLTFADFTFNANANGAVNMGVIAGINSGNIYNCALQSGVIKMSYSVDISPGFYGDYIIYGNNCYFGGLCAKNEGQIVGCNNFVDIAVNVSTHYSGDFAGFEQCIYTNFYSGGLVGTNYGTVTKSSYQNAKLTVYTHSCGWMYGSNTPDRIVCASSMAGGIIGSNQGICSETFSTSAVLSYSNNDNPHTARNYLNIGGIAGENVANGNIYNCFASSTVEGGFSNSTVVGGLVGVNQANVSNCYASCYVASDLFGAYLGGLVGINEKSIQNSYSIGTVVCSSPTIVGGFAGQNTSAGSIQNCFSSATINIADGSTRGRFVGSTSGVTFKCYFDLDAPYIVGGYYYSHQAEHSNILGINYQELWSQDFLTETMYWDSSRWIFLSTESPILEWETAINHTYESTVIEPTCTDFGYTIFHCTDCNRFFIKDIIFSNGHEFMEVEEIPATCETVGKILSYCVRCDAWITTQTIEAKGHLLSTFIERQDSTCTEQGFEIHYCANCNTNVSTVIPATGHSPVRTPPVVQNCEEVGYTEQISCGDCGEVLEERTEIAPHFYKVTIKSNPTCTDTGLCDRICTVCFIEEFDVIVPANGHTDLNGDYLCDECRVLFGKYNEKAVVEISSAEDMLAISNNLHGIYRLTQNVQLPNDWTPLGNNETPFAGYFDGNGYTITFGDVFYSDLAGVFGYNTGIIANLTVANLQVISQASINGESALSRIAVYGGISVYNAGYIIDCKATGKNSFYVFANVESDKYAKSNLLFTATYGDLVGINLASGTISNCTSDAQTSVIVDNTIICTVKWQLSALLGSLGSSQHKNTQLESLLTVTFGGIVGENRGICNHCTASGSYNVNANKNKVEVENKYGYATAITVYYHGAISGVNSGSVSNCVTLATQNFNGSENNINYVKDSHFYAKKFYYQFILNN